MIIYSVYRIVNKNNGKCYIGWTSRDPVQRWDEHRKSTTSAMTYAMQKYGKDSFEHQVIYQSLDKEHSLSMERAFIVEYNSLNTGYNRTAGGEGVCGYKQTVEHIEKRIGPRRGVVGKPHTEERRKKSSKSHIGILHTSETKRKISQSKRAKAALGDHWAKTPEGKTKISSIKSKHYCIELGNGDVITITNLKQFADDHHIRCDCLRLTLRSKKWYRGFRVISVEPQA